MRTSLILLPAGARLIAASPILLERQGLAVAVPATTPDGASDVDHGYPAFAFSAHSWHEYGGNLASPNTFSANLVSEVSSRTGSPVHIRVGGTSGDFSRYEADQSEALVLPDGAAPGQIPRGMTIGPSWFEAFQTFDNVKYTYSTHFARYKEKPNSVLATQEALKNAGSKLELLEIGNEYTFYPGDNRAADFAPEKLVSQWDEYATAIANATGQSLDYQAPVLYGNNCPWCVSNLFKKGIADDHSVSTVSVHHYQGGATDAASLQGDYMNHTRTTSGLNPFSTPIAWLKANRPRISFIFGENNSNTNTAITTGNNVTLGVFGSTLWLADYLLYGATLGVKRTHIQQSTGFTYASWRPVEYYGLPAAVLPPYYAHPFVADVIGNNGDVRIAEIDLGPDNFAAYGVWDASSNALKRVVLINLDTWRTTDDSPRPSESVTLQTGTGISGSYTVDKLTAPGADTIDASEVSWKGASWTYASNGKAVQGPSTSTTVPGSNGAIGPIDIKSSEAVIVNIA